MSKVFVDFANALCAELGKLEEKKLKLAEEFVSINGEGQKAGELALFLRFAGCDLACTYCDTAWANQKDTPYTLCSIKDLWHLAQERGIHNVTLTGGEPLLQPDIHYLPDLLLRDGFAVEIETNGAQPIAQYLDICANRPYFTMDYKLPDSGMEEKMCLENLELLTLHDTVKFVCGSLADMERAREIIGEYQLTEETKVYFSPVFGKIDPKDMVEFMKEHRMNAVRLQLQLHKFIWDPNEKGV